MDKSWRPPVAWQDFELLCYELLSANPRGGYHHLYGRAGQDQHGVDILLHTPDEGRPTGVQCKLRSELTGSALSENDVIKMYQASCRYSGGLKLLQIATTCLRETAVQDMCAQISASWQQRHPVQPLFWQDIEMLLNRHEEVARRFYPEAFSPERCVAVDNAGTLSVSLPRDDWERRLALFFSHPVFEQVAGTTAAWLHVVVSELVDNALHHRKGNASIVRLELGDTYLDILDDGKSFDSTCAKLPPVGKQFGLRAIRDVVAQSGSALSHTYRPADLSWSRFHVNRVTINKTLNQNFDPCRSSTQLHFILSREEAIRYVASLPFSEDCDSYTLRLSTDGMLGLSLSAAAGLLYETLRLLGDRPLILELDPNNYALRQFEDLAADIPTVTIRWLS